MAYAGAVTRYVALLRGVNVGGRQMVPMADLRALLTDLGFDDVATLLQSGNAVFSATGQTEAKLVRTLDKQVQETFGQPVRCVVRTASQLDAVVAHDPFQKMATDPARYTVTFLSAKPASSFAFTDDEIAPEKLTVKGREVYAWCPNGLQKAKVNKVLTEKRLGAVPTTRNWNTVVKLRDLARG
jgi:uncharacterized protein (DUF1697 family)